MAEESQIAAPEEGAASSFGHELNSTLRGFFSSDPSFALERNLLKASFGAFTLLLFIGFLFYISILRDMPAISFNLPFLLYGAISAVAVTAAISHYQSHQKHFTCMEGMMVGMTIGMMAGFLFGGIVGATNGMFVGSVFGMAVGMVTGAYCGKCCGIMGILEGLMAGLMGGTMGAMLTFMMLGDNLLLFMPLLVGSCTLILAGLTYMIFHTAGRRAQRQPAQFSGFLAISLLLAALTAIIVLYGPRSALTVVG